jgi:hypothetical protein
MKRIRACLLILRMPSAGLDEALNALREIQDFWSDWTPAPALSAPRRPQVGVSLEPRPRPELRIEEDDPATD